MLLPSPGLELGISLAGARAAGNTPVAQWIERLLPKLKVAVSITVGGEASRSGGLGAPEPRFFFFFFFSVSCFFFRRRSLGRIFFSLPGLL